jgi:N-methylhydantoinase B
MVDQYAFHDDDGGAGEFRGGKGVKLDYRVISEDAYLTVIFGRCKTPPWGMAGGQPGSGNYIVIIRKDGREEVHHSVARMRVEKGEIVRLVTATGGGYGKPRDRARERVLADLKNGFVLPERARRDYGVDVAAGTWPPTGTG